MGINSNYLSGKDSLAVTSGFVSLSSAFPTVPAGLASSQAVWIPVTIASIVQWERWAGGASFLDVRGWGRAGGGKGSFLRRVGVSGGGRRQPSRRCDLHGVAQGFHGGGGAAGLGTTLRVAKLWKRLVGEGVRVREGSGAGWAEVVSRRPGPKVTACQSQKRI